MKPSIILLFIVTLIFSQENIKEIVKENSVNFSIDPALILGIIEAESNFKNHVVSKKKAIGLMQIVPKTAGIEANKYLNNDNSIPHDTILMNPENNIKYGCAMITVLNKRYFKKIKNNQSKMYCVIAAYNTGAFNVTKAFVNKSDTDTIENFDSLNKYQRAKINLDITIQKINSMSHDTVLETMKENLPHYETVAYLDKVINNMKKY
jgi:membrane-bound lytic murein transglycosylase C